MIILNKLLCLAVLHKLIDAVIDFGDLLGHFNIVLIEFIIGVFLSFGYGWVCLKLLGLQKFFQAVKGLAVISELFIGYSIQLKKPN